jgi:hypothetical protein
MNGLSANHCAAPKKKVKAAQAAGHTVFHQTGDVRSTRTMPDGSHLLRHPLGADLILHTQTLFCSGHFSRPWGICLSGKF